MKRFFDRANAVLASWMVALALWAWPRLPDRIPTHFGIDGHADAWSDKGLVSWFLLPAVALALLLLMYWIRSVLPRRPGWVNLPDQRRLADLPEAARGPVLEMMESLLEEGRVKRLRTSDGYVYELQGSVSATAS